MWGLWSQALLQSGLLSCCLLAHTGSSLFPLSCVPNHQSSLPAQPEDVTPDLQPVTISRFLGPSLGSRVMFRAPFQLAREDSSAWNLHSVWYIARAGMAKGCAFSLYFLVKDSWCPALSLPPGSFPGSPFSPHGDVWGWHTLVSVHILAPCMLLTGHCVWQGWSERACPQKLACGLFPASSWTTVFLSTPLPLPPDYRHSAYGGRSS